MNEEWKPLIYDGLDLSDRIEVSNLGRLRNIITKREYKTVVNKKGYEVVCISLGSRNKKKLVRIHRAVACMFVEGFQQGYVVNHKDTNKSNNCSYNLEWVTNRENSYHAIAHKNETNWLHVNKRIRCKETREIFESIHDAMLWCGLKGKASIPLCLKGKQSHAGYHPITHERLSWEYA